MKMQGKGKKQPALLMLDIPVLVYYLLFIIYYYSFNKHIYAYLIKPHLTEQ